MSAVNHVNRILFILAWAVSIVVQGKVTVNVIPWACSGTPSKTNLTLIGDKFQLTLNTSQISQSFNIANNGSDNIQFNLCSSEIPCPDTANKSFVCLREGGGNIVTALSKRLSSTLTYKVETDSSAPDEEKISVIVKQRFYSPVNGSDVYAVITDLTIKCGSSSKFDQIGKVDDKGFRAIEIETTAICGILERRTHVNASGSDGSGNDNPDDGKDKGKGQMSSGLGGGDVFLIIFFVSLSFYLILGVLMKQSQGYTGWQSIPNYSFWSDLPALVIAGFLFLWAKLRLLLRSGRHEYVDISQTNNSSPLIQ